jgi:murein DD-endopeptidase MepM/ murein hydrolase activator NlpD
MIATAGIVFLSLADHRVDLAQSASTAPLDLQVAEVMAAEGADAAADPGVVLAMSLPARVAPVDQSAAAATTAKARDRLIVAAIRPDASLVSSRNAPAVATSPDRRDWDGGDFVGPAKPGPALPIEVCEHESASTTVQELQQIEETVVAAVQEITPSASASVSETLVPPSHRHPLPFEPLREPVLADSARMKGLIPSDAEHTVRYVREVRHEVRSGETLSVVLSKYGLPHSESQKWLAEVRKTYDPNRIYAGQSITLLLDMPEKRLRRARFETGKGGILVVEDNGTRVVARHDNVPQENNVRVVEGEITTNLYDVAIAKGVPDRVISEAAEVLGWEINLGRDLRRGARFRIAYEETMRLDTHESWAGKLLAVELSNGGKQYEGLHYSSSDGRTSGYYNRKGEGLGRTFLRYPVSFARISSHFSTARYHPVLKRKMPHYGVDFAAPTGTPVKAVADGVVSIAGWNGGNGRFVKMRHDPQYESGYAHLSRIASGLKPGVRVKQGQVIGYVGSTGLATGPHLHFAMYKSGKYIDPLQASLPRTAPLSGSSLAGFKAQLRRVEQAYAERGMPPFGSTKIATAAATPAKKK